ncbi:MAG: NAD(P)H-hydrate dehydratase, partial [Oscillospiraceae bacterium]|nr:NAD(P)H-hydrate dehydratase [Oscillospiraceae bacterium]
VLIFCGRGNNGGDGLAIARHLINRGAVVETVLVSGNGFSGDALINFKILVNMGAKIVDYADIENNIGYYIGSADAVTDAIYGTGIHGEISGNGKSAVEAINKYSPFTLSADIPSGIDADSGRICGVCTDADITVTFAAYKRGLLLYPGAYHTGKIILADISMPDDILKNIPVNLITPELLASLIPERDSNSHKGDYGRILICGGSRGMSGAVVMAAQAALVSGGGLITAAVPAELEPFMENKLTEAMSMALKDNDGHMTAEAADEILEKAKSCDSLLFGVGAGRSPAIFHILEKLIKNYTKTLIIDADGLFALSKNVDILNEKKCSIILTPHSGEFSRLCGIPTDTIESDRLEISRDFAKKYGVTLILKGSRTIVSDENGIRYINTSGNAGMASGGSGDVLAGMTAAFAARGISALNSAVLAVGMHGMAGDENMKERGIDSVTACGIIENISSAFKILKNLQ